MTEPPFDARTCPLEGLRLVEASAGTGKTWGITTLFVRLVLAEIPVAKILVVTFTRDATRELRDRVRARLRVAATALATGVPPPDDPDLARIILEQPDILQATRLLTAALRDFDRATISTIHSFCRLALATWAFESGAAFDAELEAEQGARYLGLASDRWARAVFDAPEPLVRYLQKMGESPASWAGLVALSDRHVDLRVHPDAEEVDLTGLEAVVAGPFARARALWQRDREGIVALFDDVSLLNQGSYKPPRIRALAVALDALFAGGPPVEMPDKSDLLTPERLQAGAKKNKAPPHHPFFQALADLSSAVGVRVERLERARIQLRRAVAAEAGDELRRTRRVEGRLAYPDLVFELADATRGARGPALARVVRARFPVALIDEFQDTDRKQYAIFRSIYLDASGALHDGCRLFLVGDPKQAIYAFRGADIHGYLAAARDAGPARSTMNRNWRSDGGLVRGVEALFQRAVQPFGHPGIDFVHVEPQHADRCGTFPEDGSEPLQFRFVQWNEERGSKGQITKNWAMGNVARAVAAEVVRLLHSETRLPARDGGSRPIRPRDVAVLTRTNRQLDTMQAAFSEAGIPAVLARDDSVFGTEEARQLEQVLAAIADPAREGGVRTALATDLLGLDGVEIAALSEGEAIPGLAALESAETESDWDAWIACFRQWRETWRERGFIQVFRAVLAHGDTLDRLLSSPGGPRRITNLLHLAELLHAQAVREHLGVEGLLGRLGALRAGAADGRTAEEEGQLRLESDADAVVLATIHRSKGLEYPVVFCPFLWDGAIKPRADVLFYEEDEHIALDVGSPDRPLHVERARWKAWTENMRLLYVAITRARHRCVVVWGRFTDHTTSALGALLHPPPGGAALSPDAAEAWLDGLNDGALWADLQALVASAGGSVGCSLLDLRPGPVWAAPAPPTTPIAARVLAHAIDGSRRTTSFSGLVRDSEDVEAVHQPDHDGQMGAPEDGEVPPEVPAAALHVGLFADLASGARAGTALHEVLEHLDFQGDDAHLVAVAAQVLPRHGYDAGPLAGPVAADLRRVLDTPLDPAVPGLTLSAVPRADRIDELEFLFPVGSSGGRLTPGRLGAAMAVGSQTDPLAAAAAEQVAVLPFSAIHGHLTGFVDLLYRHDGRFHVVDYKSNRLGDRVLHYDTGALSREMLHAHYLLQLHLYVVATHLFLAARLPGYEYDRHVGPARYLFLRGMVPGAGPRFGVFTHRPPLERVRALTAVLRDPRGGTP